MFQCKHINRRFPVFSSGVCSVLSGIVVFYMLRKGESLILYDFEERKGGRKEGERKEGRRVGGNRDILSSLVK